MVKKLNFDLGPVGNHWWFQAEGDRSSCGFCRDPSGGGGSMRTSGEKTKSGYCSRSSTGSALGDKGGETQALVLVMESNGHLKGRLDSIWDRLDLGNKGAGGARGNTKH